MRVLVFRHVPFEDLGRLRAVLDSRGIGVDYADLCLPGSAMPSADGYAGLIFMGGPMSANDDLEYLRAEMAIIRQAIASKQPVLGVCLGAQLLARALGAAVMPNGAKEIGWYPVTFEQPAGGDPLFGGFERETVFHWHGETFGLPPGSALLASSDLCRHQAFRAAPGAYGLQFHLEVTPEMIADWCRQEANCGDVASLPSPPDPHLHAARLAVLSAIVFGRWCDLLD